MRLIDAESAAGENSEYFSASARLNIYFRTADPGCTVIMIFLSKPTINSYKTVCGAANGLLYGFAERNAVNYPFNRCLPDVKSIGKTLEKLLRGYCSALTAKSGFCRPPYRLKKQSENLHDISFLLRQRLKEKSALYKADLIM